MANVNGTEINLFPTEGMKTAAKRFKKWKSEGKKGGTQVAAVRATQIISGRELSVDVVMRMHSFFARHEVDKKAEGFFSGQKGFPSPGRVAWDGWGGDGGFSWSKRKSTAIKKARERFDNGEFVEERPYPNEHAARIRRPEQFDTFRRVKDRGGEGIDFIFGIKEDIDEVELQSIRFKLSKFSAQEARTWLRENEYNAIKFEPATNEKTMEQKLLELPPEQKAAPDELKVGDFVSWNSSGGRARGMIEKIVRDGSINVPDSSFTVNGTADDPAALICVYRKAANTSGYNKTDVKVGHRFSTLTKIDDLPLAEDYDDKGYGYDDDKKKDDEEIQQFRKLDLKELKKRNKGESLIQTRELKAQIESDGNELYMSFSSEEPVQRYFGQEVLSHDKGAADLSRLNNGTAPFLWNHNRDEVLGVVQNAEISEDRRGYATVKWSRNPNAVEKRQDVEDGIISQVSFAYQINEIEERGDQMVVTKWKAMEVSLVSVPADASVGVGRSIENEDNIETKVVADSPPKEDAADLEQSREALTAQAPSSSPNLTSKNMEQKPETEAASKAVEAEQKRSETIIIAERNRSNAITAMGEKYSCPELAQKLNQEGTSIEDARHAINTYREDRLNNVEQQIQTKSAEVGLDQKEIKRFSFTRALNALANPSDRAAQEAAAYEREVSEAASKTYGKPASGILVPNEVLARDLTVGSATAGGNLVATELLSGSFIDILRNRMAVMATNPTTLTGLQGNVSIPRLTQTATGYWVGEGSAPSESQQAFDQVNMTPKTVAAFVDYSRRLLLQSSIDVESMIRDDLAKVIATKLDHTAIYGTGSSNQPLGIKDTSGIGSQTITTFGTFAEYIGMETDVAAANADVANMFYLINASARGALKSTEVASNTGKFVFENNEINGYPAITTNQLANNDVVFGDFSQFVMGFWSGLDLTVDPFAGATSGNVRVIALQDVDFAVKQAGAFCFGT